METFWMLVRYGMIGGLQYAEKKGWLHFAPGQMDTVANDIMPLLVNIVSAAGVLWGVIVSVRTRRVPKEEALRPDVQTASPVTGNPEPPSKFVSVIVPNPTAANQPSDQKTN